MKGSGIKRIAKLCENGGQTYNRKANKGVSENEVKREIVDGKDWLEQLLGKRVISFCMPSGKFKARIVQCFCGDDLCYAKDL